MKLELKPSEIDSGGELNLERNGGKISRPNLLSTYDGGFHIPRARSARHINGSGAKEAANERVINERSSLQSFTCK